MKYFISCFVLCIAVLDAFCQQRVFYISNSGNDKNDGLTVGTPISKIQKIEPGCTYLFKRDEIFYFNILRVENPGNLKITIGAYGDGAKPILSLYKTILPASWEKQGNNIWKVNLKNIRNFTGFMNNSNTNVGFIKVDGSIKGNKLNNVFLLKAQWDFYSDSMYLYVFSDDNPGKKSSLFQITEKYTVISLSNNMEITGIVVKGTGAHGIQGSVVANVTLKDLDVLEVGGSYQIGDVRYGNGIEFWHSASNCLIERCNVEQAYDVAYTIQSTEPNSIFENVTFRNNKASFNEQSFEFWVKTVGSSFKACKFVNNYCTNAGYGWSHDVRPWKKTGVHLLCYYLNEGINDLKITGNTFIRARSGYIHLPTNKVVSMFKSSNNRILLESGSKIDADDFITVGEGDKFVNKRGIEKGSVIAINK